MSENPKPKRLKMEIDEMHSVIPDELWLRFLSYLSLLDICRMGQTSHRYNILCKDPSLWKNLVFDFKDAKRSFRSINKVLVRALKVETLRFTNIDGKCHGNVDISLKANVDISSVIIRVKETLKVLIVDREIIPTNKLFVLFGDMSKLEVLDCLGVDLATTGVHAIAHLKNLKELKIPGCEEIISRDLLHLFQELKNLVGVDLTNCQKAVNNGVVEALAKNNPDLELLEIDECDKVQGTGLGPLGEHCIKLKHLSVAGCLGVNDNSIKKIAMNCPNLKHLNLSLCSGVREAGIKAIAQNCSKLQYLNLLGCSFLNEKVIKQVVEKCKELKFICTRGILYISDQFINELKKEHPNLEILHKIEAKPRTNRSEGPLVALEY